MSVTDITNKCITIHQSNSETISDLTIKSAIDRAFVREANYAFSLLGKAGTGRTCGVDVLMIKPVGDLCNLNCRYCYESQRQSAEPQGKMSEDVLKAIIHNAFRDNNCIQEIVLHGGEPLLAGQDFFHLLLNEVKKYISLDNISFSVQTNGVLLDPSWISLLQRYRFNVGISIDGDEVINDEHRIFPNGGGSYKHIIDGLKLVQEADVSYGVICVVTKATLIDENNLTNILDHFVFLGVRNIDFHPALAAEDEASSASQFNLAPNEYTLAMKRIISAWSMRKETDLVIRCIEDMIRNATGVQSDTCYMSGSCMGILGVGPNGDTVPCTRPFNSIHNFGNLATSSLKEIVSNKAFHSFAEAEKTGRNHTQDCEWSTMCGQGNCPSERQMTNSKGQKKQSIDGKHILCTCNDETIGFPSAYLELDRVLGQVIDHM